MDHKVLFYLAALVAFAAVFALAEDADQAMSEEDELVPANLLLGKFGKRASYLSSMGKLGKRASWQTLGKLGKRLSSMMGKMGRDAEEEEETDEIVDDKRANWQMGKLG